MTQRKKAFVGTAMNMMSAASTGTEKTRRVAEILRRARMAGQVPLAKIAAPGAPKIKTSAGQLSKGLAVALATGALTALASEGARAGGRGLSNLFNRSRHDAIFKKLLTRHPELKTKPEQAKIYFDLILTYGPSLARNETALVDFLKRQLQYPASSVEFIRQITDLEATVRGHIDRGSVSGRVGERAGSVAESYLAKALADRYSGA